MTPNGQIAAPFRVAIIGGSNSVIQSGYIAHLPKFLARLGVTADITNLAIGANTCQRGLMTALELSQTFDAIICEYFVNDFTFVRRYGVDEWGATFEAMLRVVRRANPSAIICLPLIGRREKGFWSTQDAMRERLLQFATVYGAIVTDIDAELRSFTGTSLRDFYKDGAHYKEGIASSHAAALIATDLASGLLRQSEPSRIDDRPRSKFDLEHTNVRYVTSFDDLAGEFSTFKNTRYNFKALRLMEGESVTIPLTGAPLAIGYISTLDACDLLCEKASGDQVRIHTVHKEVGSGKFRFLVRTMNLMTGNWHKNESCGAVTLRALRHDAEPGIPCFDEYNMLPNENSAPQSVYITSFLQTS